MCKTFIQSRKYNYTKIDFLFGYLLSFFVMMFYADDARHLGIC